MLTLIEPLSIVVEYAPNGCLKDWLVTSSAELNTDSEYENQPVPLSLLPMEQLIMFGIDVANGMSHLAAMEVGCCKLCSLCFKLHTN